MNKGNTNNCICGCNKGNEVLTVTQLDGKIALKPENLGDRDKTLVLSRTVNGAYTVRVLSTLTVGVAADAAEDPNAAFLLAEMKEPAAPVEPEEPDNADGAETTEPEEPSEGEEGIE